MMRSLWSGVSGLTTHQLEMDVIGNNIANVNTTAYKSQATGFSDVLYQTVKNGTGAGDNVATTNAAQIGLGSKVSSIYTNISKSGSMQTTGNAFDMMITGDAFFVISPDNQTRNFSRDGAFTIDAQGSLVTQNNGYYVMGVMGEDGIRPGANVTRLDLITDATKTIGGTATSASYFRGNIDSLDGTFDEADGKNVRLEVFGNDGRTYTLKFKLTNGGDDADNTYSLSLASVQDDEGNILQNTTDTNINLVYSKGSGELISAGGNENGIVTMSFGGGASMIGPLNIDFSNTTNYAGTTASHNSTIYAYKGDVRGLNVGYANGSMTGMSITDNGSVFAKYSNGQTVKIAQIAVAEFNNAMGLEKVGDNLYAESLNSGQAQIVDVTADGGYMTSGVLESSNVDLSKEFTDMITTQRGFQANSRVITTSDEMLQILRGLKR
ncbi:flagellar hook protein FlgE [Butyrivibrio hungatei]|uniref:flagellar hook protein FlgE n=1 Tax=Butyrivibrio hungatei TaxID=185008 RepID=UPI000409B107|nr:flagellar hook-basal body complex protein [Butyrivibrio hungatei]